jgi:hypothetical protein
LKVTGRTSKYGRMENKSISGMERIHKVVIVMQPITEFPNPMA